MRNSRHQGGSGIAIFATKISLKGESSKNNSMVVEREIKTLVIKAKSYFLFILTIILIGTGITLAMAKISLLLIPIGIFIFWVSPIFFQKKLRSPFIKKTVMRFSTEKISMKVFNQKSEALEQQFDIYYNQIRAFKILNSNKDDSSFLKIICKDRPGISYTFIGQSNEGKDTDITNLVVEYIHQYNNSQPHNEKITLIPSLFASKKGTVYIAILTFSLIGLLIYQIIHIPKSIPISIFASIVLTLQIISQRKRDLKDLNDFNGGNSE